MITVRLLPIAGFGLVSYGYGTTGARVRPFLAGSVLASVPTAFGYAAIGAAVSSPGDVNWYAVAPAELRPDRQRGADVSLVARRTPVPAGPTLTLGRSASLAVSGRRVHAVGRWRRPTRRAGTCDIEPVPTASRRSAAYAATLRGRHESRSVRKGSCSTGGSCPKVRLPAGRAAAARSDDD